MKDFFKAKNGKQVQLGPASWFDFYTVQKLEKICFPIDSWSWVELLAVLSLPYTVCFKAELEGRLVGFAAGEVKEKNQVGWIATICVLPEFRGNGIARRLLALCEQELQVAKVKLSVRQSNTAAVALYKKNGYQELGRWPSYYKDKEDALVMQKDIVKQPLTDSDSSKQNLKN